MSHLHNIVDTDQMCSINPTTREIVVRGKNSISRHDADSERFTFEIPRYIEGHDMLASDYVRINYINIGNHRGEEHADLYDVTDLEISQNDQNMLTFTWLISGHATQYTGTLKFAVRFLCVNDSNEVVYSWATTIGTLFVLESYNTEAGTIEPYSDIINEWYRRLFEEPWGELPSIKQEIQEEGARVLETIPEDYTELSRKVNELDGLASVLIDPSTITWGQFSQLVDKGAAERLFPVGTLVVSPWTDTQTSVQYAQETHVGDYHNVTLDDGSVHRRVKMQAHWAHPFGVQFSHARAFYACDNGLSAGTYYFTIESSWGSNVVAGTVVQFTLPENVPAGGRLSGCEGAPDQPTSNWRIFQYAPNGIDLVRTIVPVINPSAPTGTNLGIQHLNTRNGLLNSTQEMAYGYARWAYSAIRQYLNSNLPKLQWWTAVDKWDIRPNELLTKDGFLCGVPADLLAVMKTNKIITYTNTVTDDGSADVTYDKVYLASLEEMYINPQINGEGSSMAYWKNVNGTPVKWAQYGTYELLKHYGVENHAIAQRVRLRSANRGNAYIAWNVYASGYVSNYSNAANAIRFCPVWEI